MKHNVQGGVGARCSVQWSHGTSNRQFHHVITPMDHGPMVSACAFGLNLITDPDRFNCHTWHASCCWSSSVYGSESAFSSAQLTNHSTTFTMDNYSWYLVQQNKVPLLIKPCHVPIRHYFLLDHQLQALNSSSSFLDYNYLCQYYLYKCRWHCLRGRCVWSYCFSKSWKNLLWFCQVKIWEARRLDRQECGWIGLIGWIGRRTDGLL